MMKSTLRANAEFNVPLYQISSKSAEPLRSDLQTNLQWMCYPSLGRISSYKGKCNVLVGQLASHLNGPGRARIFTCGNRAGRCRWSAGFLCDLPFPLPLHSSMSRAVQIYSLTGYEGVVGGSCYPTWPYGLMYKKCKNLPAWRIFFVERKACLTRACGGGSLLSLRGTRFGSAEKVQRYRGYYDTLYAVRCSCAHFTVNSLQLSSHGEECGHGDAAVRYLSGLSRFTETMRSGATPYSPHLTLIGSQDPDFKMAVETSPTLLRGAEGFRTHSSIRDVTAECKRRPLFRDLRRECEYLLIDCKRFLAVKMHNWCELGHVGFNRGNAVMVSRERKERVAGPQLVRTSSSGRIPARRWHGTERNEIRAMEANGICGFGKKSALPVSAGVAGGGLGIRRELWIY
ncbi:hypothetical protein PR048_028033 [Dryococelus australis]|uniref:SWIM-type domain-containing protein n=1 Tax=Dryococelus australis TaxID=614101 RepID=A0ABQ9GI74_9NEOP|nr:hypothetical protein PR048_028033 [Dryococelus australis]